MYQTLTNATLIALLTSVGIALPLTHAEEDTSHEPIPLQTNQTDARTGTQPNKSMTPFPYIWKRRVMLLF